MSEQEIIFALSSGGLPSGVALIRLSGEGASDVLKRLSQQKSFEPRKAVLCEFIDPENDEIIDHGLALYFPAGNSFTGEEIVEFHLHGGRAVVAKMLNVLARQANCRPAERGEFSRRALENGRLDLTEIEGLRDLVAAETEMQRKQAHELASGHFGKKLDDWRQRIIRLRAFLEAEFDFPDEEEVEGVDVDQLSGELDVLSAEIKTVLADSSNGEIIRQGFHVVLAGRPNAGKSTLLNALAKRDIAIVSEEAGTTRDVLETRLDLDGFFIRVTDTAGIRQSENAIEQEGIRRARSAAASGDLVLWLEPADDLRGDGSDDNERENDTQFRQENSDRLIIIKTKADLGGSDKTLEDEEILTISAKTGAGMNDLIVLIKGEAESAISGAKSKGMTGNSRISFGAELSGLSHRHHFGLEKCLVELDQAAEQVKHDKVLGAENLRRAAVELGALTGREDIEDLLDVIFSEMCIGK